MTVFAETPGNRGGWPRRQPKPRGANCPVLPNARGNESPTWRAFNALTPLRSPPVPAPYDDCVRSLALASRLQSLYMPGLSSQARPRPKSASGGFSAARASLTGPQGPLTAYYSSVRPRAQFLQMSQSFIPPPRVPAGRNALFGAQSIPPPHPCPRQDCWARVSAPRVACPLL